MAKLLFCGVLASCGWFCGMGSAQTQPAVAAPAPAPAQAQATKFNSHEVHADGTITFRVAAPGAQKVMLRLENTAKPSPMTKGTDGVWSVTTAPLPPEIYGYGFNVDGLQELDPLNDDARPNLLSVQSNVLVPGATPQPWEMQAVPHGDVTHHIFTTKIAVGLPLNQSDYYVYTPPGYDAKRAQPYPVLYLLHGFTDSAVAWTETGKANLILDALIAQGKAKPMVVVMPLGYGDAKILRRESFTGNLLDLLAANTEAFRKLFVEELMPRVEREYHVRKDREGRAIAGLSMGGQETYLIGMTHTAEFAWIGTFSGGLENIAPERIPKITPAAAKLRLLWLSCGTEDPRITPTRTFVKSLQAQGFDVKAVETPGMHTWQVWRDNLVNFAPLLFQPR